jgi:type I restriction enzyme S subunit
MSVWKFVRVGDLGKIVTGKTPKTSVSEYYGGTIPFLTPSDDMDSKYVPTTARKLTDLGVRSVIGSLIPNDSVCVSCIGTKLGKVTITKEDTVTNQQINSIVVNKNLYDVSFVYYSMLILGKQLNYISKTSTAVPIVNKKAFSENFIKCPPLAEQRKISSLLSLIDNKIINNQEINDNLAA